MVESVRQFAPDDWKPLKRLGSYNGFGFRIMGFTGEDPSGRCFGTRWLVLAQLPVLPRRRYYLRKGLQTTVPFGTVSSYDFAGVAPLRFTECVRTFLYCWLLAPAIVIVPLALWLVHADQIVGWVGSAGWGVGLLIIVMLLLLFGSIGVLVALQSFYEKRLAPVREVRWVEDTHTLF